MGNSKIPPPLITKEHGSWAVLLVPMLVSASVVGKWTIDFVLLTLSAFGFFMSYVPVHILLRNLLGVPHQDEKLTQAKFWAAMYLFIGAAFILPLLMKGYIFLLPIGALGAIAFFGNFILTRRYFKTIASDLLAVAGLTLSAPSAYYVLTGLLDTTALLLFILNFLFFGCSVFYVHMKIRASATKKTKLTWTDKLSLGKLNLLYHAAVILIVGILAATSASGRRLDSLSGLVALIAFTPMFIHGVYGTVKLSGRIRFKNLGFLLLAQSILFGILLGYFSW